jgi:hypothetical protein
MTPDALASELMTSQQVLEGVSTPPARSTGEETRRRRPAQSRPSRPTVAACVRGFCLACQGAENARGAYDCRSEVCPLYACMPFRGKPMPKHLAPPRDAPEPDGHGEQAVPSLPKRRASKALVTAYCRHCQADDPRTDCGAADCALFPWRPWQPGGQPKVRAMTESQKKRLRSIGGSSQFQNARQ